MKAQLTFDLDDPFDEIAHKRCVKSLDMALCLLELSQIEIPDKYKKKILDIIESHDVNPDKLTI